MSTASPSRILILYASSHGQTAVIARTIAERLRGHGHIVAVADCATGRPPPPTQHDAVIIGSRIQVGKHAAVIRHYVAAHRVGLADRPTAFFAVSMSAAGKPASSDPNGYLERFFQAQGWRPSLAASFGGGLAYRSYGWLLRLIMRELSRRGGHSTDTSRDHVYTDWAEVTRFADDFARLCADHGRSTTRASTRTSSSTSTGLET